MSATKSSADLSESDGTCSWDGTTEAEVIDERGKAALCPRWAELNASAKHSLEAGIFQLSVAISLEPENAEWHFLRGVAIDRALSTGLSLFPHTLEEALHEYKITLSLQPDHRSASSIHDRISVLLCGAEVNKKC